MSCCSQMSCNFAVDRCPMYFNFFISLNSKIDLQFRFKTRKRKSLIWQPASFLFSKRIFIVSGFTSFRIFDFLKDASKKLSKRYECCGSLATCQVQTTRCIQFPVIQWIKICRSSKVQRQPV